MHAFTHTPKTNPIKPNSNPKQTQYKANFTPIKPKTNPKQTQSKPIFVPQKQLIVYNASKSQYACLEEPIYAEQNH